MAATLALVASPASANSFSTTEGSPFSGIVATGGGTISGASACPSSWPTGTANIIWGDGTSGTGVATVTGCTPSGPNQISFTVEVSAAHTYAEEATNIPVSASCSFGSFSATATGTATVDDALLNAAGASGLTAVEGSATSLRVATFSDANASATASDFSATIAWGDGSRSAGTVVPQQTGVFEVLGTSPAYAEEGRFTATVTINDRGGSNAVATPAPVIDVSDAPLSAAPVSGVSAVQGSPSTVTLATFGDGDPAGTAGDYSATIDWGDGTQTAGVINFANGSGTVSGAHSYATAGAETAIVTIRDVGGSVRSVDAPVNVAGNGLGSGTGSGGTPGGGTTSTTGTSGPSGPGTSAGSAISSLGAISVTGPVASFALACTGQPGQACAVTVVGKSEVALRGHSATVAGKRRGGKGRQSGRTRTLTVAAASFTIPAGASAQELITLNATGQHLLASLGRLNVALSFSGSFSATRDATFTLTRVTLALPPDNWYWQTSNCNPCYTLMRSLPLGHLPGGSRVTILCHGRGCGFAQRTLPQGEQSVNVAALFAGRQLFPGTVVVVEVKVRGRVGEAVSYAIHSKARPSRTILCLAPGAAAPGQC